MIYCYLHEPFFRMVQFFAAHGVQFEADWNTSKMRWEVKVLGA